MNGSTIVQIIGLALVMVVASFASTGHTTNAGITGIGILSGQNSGQGGLLGLDVINNDSLAGIQLGGASLADLGDIADPVANSAQALGAGIRGSLSNALTGANSTANSFAIDAAPLAGLALGNGADASGNLAGLGVLTGDQVVNNNVVSAVALGGNLTGNGDALGAAVLSGNGAGNGGLVGAAILSGNASGNGGLVGASVLSGNGSGNGGVAGVSVLSGNGTGNGGLLGASLASGDNSGNVLGFGQGALLQQLQGGSFTAFDFGGLNGGNGLFGIRVAATSDTPGQLLDVEALSTRRLLSAFLLSRPLLDIGPGVPQITTLLESLRVSLRDGSGSLRPQLLSLIGGNAALLPASLLPTDNAIAALLQLGFGAGAVDSIDSLLAIHAFTGQDLGNGDLISLSLLGSGNNANGRLLGAAVLDGDNSGNGGLVGASILGGNNSGNGDLLGASILSGDNSGIGGLIGLGVLSGNNAGTTGLNGLAGIGVLNAGNSGIGGAGGVAAGGSGNSAGGFNGLSGLLAQLQFVFGNGSLPVIDGGIVSGGDNSLAQLLDLSVLEGDDLLDLSLGGVRLLQLNDPAGLVTLAEGLRDQLRIAGLQILPALIALPGGQSILLPMIIEINEATEALAGLLLGPALDPAGNVLGLAILRDRPDGDTPAIGLAVLGGNNDGNGELAGLAVLSGDNSGNGGVLGGAVLSGDNSGNGQLAGLDGLGGGAQNNGTTPGSGGAGPDGSGLGGSGADGSDPAAGDGGPQGVTDNPVDGLDGGLIPATGPDATPPLGGDGSTGGIDGLTSNPATPDVGSNPVDTSVVSNPANTGGNTPVDGGATNPGNGDPAAPANPAATEIVDNGPGSTANPDGGNGIGPGNPATPDGTGTDTPPGLVAGTTPAGNDGGNTGNGPAAPGNDGGNTSPDNPAGTEIMGNNPVGISNPDGGDGTGSSDPATPDGTGTTPDLIAGNGPAGDNGGSAGNGPNGANAPGNNGGDTPPANPAATEVASNGNTPENGGAEAPGSDAADGDTLAGADQNAGEEDAIQGCVISVDDNAPDGRQDQDCQREPSYQLATN